MTALASQARLVRKKNKSKKGLIPSLITPCKNHDQLREIRHQTRPVNHHSGRKIFTEPFY